MNGLFQPPQQPMPDMSAMYPQGRPQVQVPQMPGNGQPIQPNGGLQQTAQQLPPQGMTQEQAEADAMDALAAQQQKPKYSVGVPELDKYINMFLGA